RRPLTMVAPGKARGRARQAIPLARDPSGRTLPLLVAIMVYLAALAVAGGLAVAKLAERWDSGLAGAVPVQLFGEAADEASLAAVVDALAQTPGVLGAEVLGDAATAALLEPWLGSALLDDLPLPRLVAVTVDPAAPPESAALQERLAAIAPGVLVDDH